MTDRAENTRGMGTTHGLVAFGLAALLALCTVPLLPPRPVEDKAYLYASGALLAGLLASALARRARWASVAPLALSLAFLGAVALLRHGEGGANSTLGPLVMLPVLWIALYRSGRELAVVIAAVGAVFIVPIISVGAPDYPAGELTRAVVWLLVAGIAGFVVHKLVAQVRRTSAEALAHAQAEDEILALVSHDLKNPLGSIAVAAEMLGRETAGLSDTDRRLATMIDREARRTMRRVDDLLLLGQMSAGRLVLREEEVDLAELLEERVEAAAPLAVAHGLDLIFEGIGSRPCRVDADRICQAVDNLIANAIKFTPRGGRVTVSLEDLGEGIAIAVRDTGCGIPEADRAHVFRRFYRAQPVGQAAAGTGLGLSIVTAIARMHHGCVSLESEPSRGTSVTLVLPGELRAVPAGDG